MARKPSRTSSRVLLHRTRACRSRPLRRSARQRASASTGRATPPRRPPRTCTSRCAIWCPMAARYRLSIHAPWSPTHQESLSSCTTYQPSTNSGPSMATTTTTTTTTSIYLCFLTITTGCYRASQPTPHLQHQQHQEAAVT
jgi:hypothetical protein